MTELALSRKLKARKNQGGGAGPLPLKQKYVRKKQGKSKHKEDIEVKTIKTTLRELPPLAAKHILEKDMGVKLTNTENKVTPELLAELERKIEELEEKQITAKDQRVADRLDEEAQKLTASGQAQDYGSAVKLAAGGSGGFGILTPEDYGASYPRRHERQHPEPNREALDSRAKAIMLTDSDLSYGDAVRAAATEMDLTGTDAAPLDARAKEIQLSDRVTYSEAMRQAVAEQGITDLDANREGSQKWAGAKRPMPDRTAAEEAELRKEAKARGYDI